MKTFFKKISIFIAILFAAFTVTNFFSSTPVFAADSLGSCRNFLGLTSWDCGINDDINNTDELINYIVIIAANILTDITVLAAYLVLAYTIYGGYLYIFSSGDPGKVASGKKTLTRAFIGLAIVGLANIILNTIRIVFLGESGTLTTNCATNECVNQVDFISGIISWLIGVAGLVAAGFIVIGGISYVTSSGVPGKIQKAKNTIVYALIGLVVVGLAQLITAFVSNLVRDASSTAYNNQTLISKEYHED